MDYFTGWIWKTLEYLGFYQKSGNLLLLGLDNAGKTTLLHVLKENKLLAHIPTSHPTKQTVTIGGVSFSAHDLGGHEAARRLWKEYFEVVDAIVFIIDVHASDRFEEAKKELNHVLSDEKLSNVPVLILANKVDMVPQITEYYVKQVFNLEGKSTGKLSTSMADTGRRPLEVFLCSITSRSGYPEGFKWLSNFF